MKLIIPIKKPVANKEQAAPEANITQPTPEPCKTSLSPGPTTTKAKPLPTPTSKPKTKLEAKPAKGSPKDGELGPPPLTLKQIAAHLGVCTKTVRRIIKKKGIPYGMVGGQIRIPAEHLPLFIDKHW